MANLYQVVIEICREHTNLSVRAIEKILEVSKSIDLMTDFYESDVFIDVLSKDDLIAYVVVHGKPDKNSIYKERVVGKEAFKENEPGVIEVLKSGKLRRDIKALTQENKLVKQTIQPIKLENDVIGVIIVEKDISDDIKEDFSINKSENSSRSYNFINMFKNNDFLIDNLNSAVLVFDEYGYLKIKNHKADELYKSLDFDGNIINKHYNELTLQEDDFETACTNTNDFKVNEINIDEIYLTVKNVPLKDEGLRLATIIHNITDMKLKEAELVSKSVAVREAHHRVKNNLYTVISLLRRQSRLTKNEEVKASIGNTINRVYAILSTHHLLSKTMDNNISIKNAIGLLISNIQRGYKDNKEINIGITGDDFNISGDKSTSLLLVLNEIIQNCYDHAYKDRCYGNIQILINKEEKFKSIAIIDDGVGIDEDKINKDSLGNFIIESYIKEVLRGEIIRQSNKDGTKIIIKIPT